MSTPPPLNPQPLAGWKKFAVSLGVIVAAILVLLGIMMVILAVVMATTPPAGTSQPTQAWWFVAGSVVVTIGFAWVAFWLNEKLKVGKPTAKKAGNPRSRGNPFVCVGCQDEAPLMEASLKRHIGAILIMFHYSINGRFCKKCFMANFWKCTLVTLFCGWWGMISLFLTPIVLINNLFMLIRSFSLPGKPHDAARPMLREEHAALLKPISETVLQRIRSGEDEEIVSRDVSQSTGITPGQAYLFVRTIRSMPTGAVA